MSRNIMPLSFFYRRMHSLTGLCLVLFLFEHFITNSQAAYWLNEANGFVKSVNFLQSIPYLRAFEIVLIGIPILFHAFLGIKYLRTSENNDKKTDGSKPSLNFSRNKAYHFQRITSYILIVLVVFHVIQMRFIRHPKKIELNNQVFYLVKIKEDKNLYKVIEKMQAKIFTKSEKITDQNLLALVNKFKLTKNQIVAMTQQSGQAFLLNIRDVMKNPFMVGIYSIFVFAGTFHAINGLWTFLITWGFIISNRSQKTSLNICFWIMISILALGITSIWSSFLY
jgi:succinate dehydrogenase / fumarate reductase, cytochrome b subunit